MFFETNTNLEMKPGGLQWSGNFCRQPVSDIMGANSFGTSCLVIFNKYLLIWGKGNYLECYDFYQGSLACMNFILFQCEIRFVLFDKKKKGSCLGWINVTPRVDRILFDIDVLPMYFFINFLALLWILIGKSLSTFFTAVLGSSSDRLLHTNYSHREIFHQVLYWNVPYQGFIQISANPHCCIGDWVSITKCDTPMRKSMLPM